MADNRSSDPGRGPDSGADPATPSPPSTPSALSAHSALSTQRLTVTTPWHPSAQRPFAGSFVQAATRAIAPRFARAELFHTEDWPGPANSYAARVVRRAHDNLLRRENNGVAARLTDDGYWVTDVPTPVTPKRDYADWAYSHEAALGAVLNGAKFDADVVHGHVGTYGGWLALRFAPRKARVVVTEHASFLGRMLGQPRSRAIYAQVMERADAVTCVSDALRTRLATAFPGHAAKISVLPNAVDIEAMPVRPKPVQDLHRWIFVGKVAAPKGVPELVEAFALAARDEPRLRLTVLGSGPLVSPLRARAAELGLSARIEFVDAVPPERVFEYLHEHDLLVHPSKGETFGMTVVEAVGAGMPVLVTRCGGPQETLAGLEGVAGALIEVSDDPAVIVDGYRALAAQADRLDPDRARDVLIGRYGSAAVADRLAAVYLGSEGRERK
jgi:glycosyltransferase involved in cell wall biosynthesis